MGVGGVVAVTQAIFPTRGTLVNMRNAIYRHSSCSSRGVDIFFTPIVLKMS